MSTSASQKTGVISRQIYPEEPRPAKVQHDVFMALCSSFFRSPHVILTCSGNLQLNACSNIRG